MKLSLFFITFLVLLLASCSLFERPNAVFPDVSGDNEVRLTEGNPGYVSWGTFDLMIERDGSEWQVVPNRAADHMTWGYHLNAVKLLEVSPGQNCIKIERIEVLPEGDLAVDISIKHPYNNPVYTGFDVRGILMFPSSQYIPDNELRKLAGREPFGMWWYRFASSEKGDAQLMNPDGYTSIFAPDDRYSWGSYELEEGYPIFEYFEGQLASGENLGTVNGFKRYHSNETRHMFEVGRTITRTFIIRPPADGPVLASYAVYAHWIDPLVMPVTNPATDFPPEANSPMPYDFRIEQVGLVDLDAPKEVNNQNVIWHISSWNYGIDNWHAGTIDVMGEGSASNFNIVEMFSTCADCYYYEDTFRTEPLASLPGGLPGTWPMLFRIAIDNDGSIVDPHLATDFYVQWLDIEAYDGEW